MLQVGSWFGKPRRNSNDDTLRPSADYGSTDVESPTKHETSPLFTNPHDAALAGLYGLGPKGEGPSEKQQKLRYLLDETLYDPFSGGKIGQLHPQVISDKDAEVKNEELWTGLSRVLDLQSEVATMHMQMERGRSTSAKPARKTRKAHRKWKRAGGVGDTVDEVDEVGAGDSDDPAGDFSDADEEFDDVTADFDDRRKAIDAVMEKLDNLSEALTTFHQLQTPSLNLTAMKEDNNESPQHKPSLIKKPSRHTQLRATAVPLGHSSSAPATTLVPAPGPPSLTINTQMFASTPVVDSPSSMAFEGVR